MDSKERRDNQPSQPPSEPAADFRALVENLAQPVVIIDRAGKVRFMNPRAERLLAQGFKERVEAHLQNVAVRPPASLVRFRVDGAADLILRIRLSDIAWQGQPATQVSLTDVTPYAANAERFSQDMAKLKERNHALQEWRTRLEAQVRSLAAERDAVYASSSQRLAQETARFQKSQREAQAQRDGLEAQIRELRAEAAQLRAAAPAAEPANEEFVKARRTIDELTAARRELEARAEQSAAQLRQLQEAAAQAESRLAAAQEQSRGQAQAEAQQLRAQIAEGENAMAEADERNRRLDEQINQLSAAHENATRQLQDAAAARDRAQEEIARLQPLANQLAQSGAQFRQKSADLDRSREAGGAMERELAAARRVLGELRAGREALEERIKEQVDQLLKSSAQVQAQAAERAKAKAENERLRQQVAELRAEREAERGRFQAQVRELSADHAQSKAELDRERAGRRKALDEAARLQQEIPNSTLARSKIEEQRAQLQGLVQELTAAQAQSNPNSTTSAPSGRRRSTRPRGFSRNSPSRPRREAESRRSTRSSRRRHRN